MGFKKLFWGFIFFFDFRIGGIDLLPDIIAYILFYQGLRILADRNERFGKAKAIAFPLIFVSLLDIYQVSIPFDQIGNISMSLVAMIAGFGLLIINVVMIYQVCIGIAEEAGKLNNSSLESKAISRWKIYLVSNVLIFITIIGVAFPGLVVLLALGVMILSIVSYFLMLGLIKTAADELEGNVSQSLTM